MADYNKQEQEMEIEALEAILMDDFKVTSSSQKSTPAKVDLALRTVALRFLFVLRMRRQMKQLVHQLALVFSHTENYPDEPPLLSLKSLKGILSEDLRILKEKLDQEAKENLGLSMIFTLVSSAKEWLSERYCQDAEAEEAKELEATKDEIIVPHGEPVTVDSFLAWRERYEAELALERAKLMPDSALAVTKEKRLTGRQWFATAKGATAVAEDDEVDEDDIDFDEDDMDFEDDEEDMLEHYLAET